MGALIRVLHVDDDPEFADLTATFLERENGAFAVETATDADDGLARLDGGDVDCVVSDYDMPGRNGIEFLKAVREDYPDLPFILFTGKGSEGIASEAVSAGVTDYLRKGSGTERYALLANRIGNAVEARRSRRALRERTRRLETLISNLPGMVYRCRNERGWPMESVEGDAETLTGYTAAALEADVTWGEEVIHSDDREAVWRIVQDALATDNSFEVTYRIVTADGITKWVWEQGSGVDGENGDPEALEGFITDITERTEYERRIEGLHDATQRLMAAEAEREVVEITTEAARDVLGLPCSVFRLLDGDDRLVPVAVSDEMATLGGQRPTYEVGEPTAGRAFAAGETVVYEDVTTLDDDVDRGAVRAAMYLPVGDCGVLTIADDRVGSFDGPDVDLAEVLVDHAATALDLVERTGALRRQNERLEEFVGIVSHDLRSPLSVAEGRLELAREECESDHLGAAADAVARSRALVDDLLTLAREGERVTELAAVDLAATAEDCWQHVETSAATLAVRTDRTIRADRSRLNQLFENLVRNAVRHGGDDVTITVGDLDGGFYVADDGPGIADDRRAEVFEPGYTTREGGTGFGLAIVAGVVEAHGWEIELAESAAGGARFEITGVGVVR
ncbi:MAG: response regulator [Haloferacaceae archaeon]